MPRETEIRTTAEAAEDHAIPRRHESHCGGDAAAGGADAPAAKSTMPRQVTATPAERKSAAAWAYERLILYIQNFEKTLDSEHEVAMGFTGAQAGVLRIEGMGFFDPDIITFYGSDASGGRTQLVQHVSQLNVILRALPKPEAATEPQRIGFRLAADLERAEAEDDEAGTDDSGTDDTGTDDTGDDAANGSDRPGAATPDATPDADTPRSG